MVGWSEKLAPAALVLAIVLVSIGLWQGHWTEIEYSGGSTMECGLSTCTATYGSTSQTSKLPTRSSCNNNSQCVSDGRIWERDATLALTIIGVVSLAFSFLMWLNARRSGEPMRKARGWASFAGFVMAAACIVYYVRVQKNYQDTLPSGFTVGYGNTYGLVAASAVFSAISATFFSYVNGSSYSNNNNRQQQNQMVVYQPQTHQVTRSQPSSGGTGVSAPTISNRSPQVILEQIQTRRGRIDMAALAMIRFTSSVMSTADRCSVVAFNEDYKPVILLGDETTVQAAMFLLTDSCTGSTHLWDAIVISVLQFLKTADQSRPWVLIILTDGEDNGSKCSLNEAAEVLGQFNKGNNNFCCLIGLGNDVKASDLQNVCSQSGSLYVPASQTEALDQLFALIALQVTRGVRVDITRMRSNSAEAVYAEISQQTTITRQPVDMLFLVDISGSMTSR